MIAHTQTIFVDDPRGIPGDCMRTAVASLLDLPTEAVPHFVLFAAPGVWFEAFNLWLKGRGLRIKPLPEPTTECLALGISPRDVEHVVVWGPNGLVHDPHPSRAGIEARQFWAIVPVVDTSTPRMTACPECDGSGRWSELDEDHPGHANQGTCERCNGDGVIDTAE